MVSTTKPSFGWGLSWYTEVATAKGHQGWAVSASTASPAGYRHQLRTFTQPHQQRYNVSHVEVRIPPYSVLQPASIPLMAPTSEALCSNPDPVLYREQLYHAQSRHLDWEQPRNTSCGEHTRKLGLFPQTEDCL